MCFPDRFWPDLTKFKIFHLSLGNKVFDGSCYIFNGYVGIETVLVQQFYCINIQTLQRSFYHLTNAFGFAVKSSWHIIYFVSGIVESEFCAYGNLALKLGKSLTYEFFVDERAVGFCSIKSVTPRSTTS